MDKLPVIFRAERSGPSKGDVTAVFPTMPWTATDFAVYAHVGQHSAGNRDWYNTTRAATPAEYADLLEELRGIYGRSTGTDDSAVELVVCQRYSRHHRDAFNAEWKRLNKAMPA